MTEESQNRLQEDLVKDTQEQALEQAAAKPAESAGAANKTLKIVLVLLAVLALVALMYFLKNGVSFGEKNNAVAIGSLSAEDLALDEGVTDIDALLEANVPLLVDFSQSTCQPCILMHPDLEAAHATYAGKAIVKCIDTAAHPGVAGRFPVKATPTQVFILPGEKPYVPSENVKAAGITFLEYANKTTGDHALTVHEGMLSEEELNLILDDMIAQSTKA